MINPFFGQIQSAPQMAPSPPANQGYHQNWDPDSLSVAASVSLGQVAHMESEWDFDKMQKNVCRYFRQGAKGLDFTEDPSGQVEAWKRVINDYADKVFASIFQAMGDRKWMEEADFLLIFDAGVKQMLPPELFLMVSVEDLESEILAAHDRSFEEQRFAPALWEVVQKAVEGKKMAKKVYDAVESGRKGAVLDPMVEFVEGFIQSFIGNTLKGLEEAAGNQGPRRIMGQGAAGRLFYDVIATGKTIPRRFPERDQPPKDKYWSVISQYNEEAYEASDNGWEQKGGAVKRAYTWEEMNTYRGPAEEFGADFGDGFGADGFGFDGWLQPKGKGGWLQMKGKMKGMMKGMVKGKGKAAGWSGGRITPKIRRVEAEEEAVEESEETFLE
jgi:hypothetical protein